MYSIERTMNNVINITGFFKVIFILFLLSDLSVFGERLLWQNEAEINAEPILRHYKHHKNKQKHNEDITEVYSKPKTNLRHRSHHHQNYHHTTTTTIATPTTTELSTTTTTQPPFTTTIKSIQTPEEHRLRHSNKFYPAFNPNHDYNHEKSNVRRYINQSSYPTSTPSNPWKILVSSTSYNNKKQSHGARHFYNVSKLTQHRLFDRDGAYYSTRPPKIRHPYDVLKVPYKERVRFKPVRQYFDHNDLWDDSRFTDDNDDDDIVDWSTKKRHLKFKSHRRGKKMQDEYEDYGDYYEDDEDGRLQKKNQERDSLSKDPDDIFSKSYIPGTLTKHKFETLGTRDAVKDSRQNYLANQIKEEALAADHVNKIFSQAMCKWPKPRVIAVQNDPGKLYTPHCTILHRCGDDSGCCSTNSRTCTAKYSEDVHLYFYVKQTGQKTGTIEKRTFVNDTECFCDLKDNVKSPPPEEMRRATVISCTCTKAFEQILEEDGKCRCDCSSNNYACDWKKKGREHFSMEDRKCVLEGRCNPPTCEFGRYDKRHGRCPRKDDTFTTRVSYLS